MLTTLFGVQEWESGKDLDAVVEGVPSFDLPKPDTRDTEGHQKLFGVKEVDNVKKQEVCSLSGEKLVRVYDEEEDEWIYEGTVWLDGPGSEIVLKSVLDAMGQA